MHPMMIVGVVLHVTLFAVLAFFVLFAAQKAQGLVKLLGTIIGVWLLILAVLVIAACVTAPMFGGRPFGMPMAAHMGYQDRACAPAQTPNAALPTNAANAPTP